MTNTVICAIANLTDQNHGFEILINTPLEIIVTFYVTFYVISFHVTIFL